METLTLQELAELKGCHRVRIQQLVTEGFYKSVQVKNSRGRLVHAIPLDQLTEEEQQKYYRSKGILSTNIEVQNAEKLEFMSTQEREECVFGKTLLMNGSLSGIKKTQEIRVKLMNYSSQR